MNLALSMWSIHRTVRDEKWTVLDFLQFCLEEGIKEVELLDVFWHDVDSEPDRVKQFVQENSMRVVSYAVSNDFVQRDVNARNQALQSVLEGIGVAKRLGTSIVRVFAGDVKDNLSYAEGLQWIVEGLTAAAAEAEKAGITLCLENHGQYAGRGAQVQEIIEKVGSNALRATLDVGNFLLVDEDPIEGAKVLLPFVAHVHMKDFKQQDDGIYKSLGGKAFVGSSLYEGDVAIQAILNRLTDHGYRGAYVLEYEGAGNERDGIRLSYANFSRQTNLS